MPTPLYDWHGSECGVNISFPRPHKTHKDVQAVAESKQIMDTRTKPYLNQFHALFATKVLNKNVRQMFIRAKKSNPGVKKYLTKRDQTCNIRRSPESSAF